MSVALRFVPFAALCLGLTVLGPMGCAGANCQRVKDSLDTFDARPGQAGPQDHLVVSVPFSTVDPLLTNQARAIKGTSVSLPAIAGVSLGRATARIQTVRLREREGQGVGLSVRVGLVSGKKTIVDAEIDATIVPRLDPTRGVVVLALDAKQIDGLRPSLGDSGVDQLVDFVWGQLPAGARQLTTKSQLKGLVAGISEPLLAQLSTALADNVLPDLGELARFELELPEVPLASMRSSTSTGRLELRLDTGLPLPPVRLASGAVPGLDERMVHVRIPGPLAAELGNWAMREGEIPRRYNLAGSPDPAGKVVAGLGWQSGPKPLKVHLWATEGDCAEGIVSATPRVGIVKHELVLATDDASLESLRGSLKVRAGVWFSGLGRETFELTETTAASMRATVAGRPLQARVETATLRGDELIFGVVLSIR